MLDGATAMDPGINRPATRVSVESLAEVKSRDLDLPGGIRPVERPADQRGHQERHEPVPRVGLLGRAELEVEREPQDNILNGDPKPFEDEMDWGFAIGGPVGRPGGNNKLFFYFNLEFNPRTFGNDVNRYRVPTVLERQGDFSQSRDNNGNLYPYIKDPLVAGTCSAAEPGRLLPGWRRARPDSARTGSIRPA